MSTNEKLGREWVQPWADVFAKTLRNVCEEVVIAGSLRRQLPMIGDIEIVLLPALTTNLLGERVRNNDALQLVIDDWIERNILAWPATNRANGDKYKKLWCNPLKRAVDLFIANENNFGNTLAIRTGDRDFSQMLVALQGQGGLMPESKRQDDGHLWDVSNRQRVMIPCRTEEAFFDTLGIPCIDPEIRDIDFARQLRSEIGLIDVIPNPPSFGPRVYNKHQNNAPAGSIEVTRGTVWGNTITINAVEGAAAQAKERDAACDGFDEMCAAWARRDYAGYVNWLTPLISKNLVCVCAPRRCHADILLRRAAELERMEKAA